MPPVLSPKQKRLLDYLRRRIQRDGSAPSLRRAAGDLGVSHAAVAQGLRILEEKGYLRRDGRYSRSIYLLNPGGEAAGLQRWREVPVVGRITAGLPIYAQQEWDGSLVLDGDVFRGRDLFALRVRGDSMRGAGILDGDLAVCEPRQYAADGEIVVALIDGEEATVKHFFHHPDHIELRPANPAYAPMHYGFSRVMVQGKVVGIHRSVA
ncbi:MAG: transcriptional repressor LexA [Desulfobacteraceae bacterium]|nr:transcriptional repressor LexA [Desulfobacteraceae bacterium]MDD3992256.1 transcriptional repressor LexA [Desulfobacteraceae bacterium]